MAVALSATQRHAIDQLTASVDQLTASVVGSISKMGQTMYYRPCRQSAVGWLVSPMAHEQKAGFWELAGKTTSGYAHAKRKCSRAVRPCVACMSSSLRRCLSGRTLHTVSLSVVVVLLISMEVLQASQPGLVSQPEHHLMSQGCCGLQLLWCKARDTQIPCAPRSKPLVQRRAGDGLALRFGLLFSASALVHMPLLFPTALMPFLLSTATVRVVFTSLSPFAEEFQPEEQCSPVCANYTSHGKGLLESGSGTCALIADSMLRTPCCRDTHLCCDASCPSSQD